MQNIKAYVMLVCASLFWAGNFMIGKYAFFSEIPPLTLVFYRWSFVWIILLPFTYKEIIKHKDTILNNLPLLFFLGLTSVGLYNVGMRNIILGRKFYGWKISFFRKYSSNVISIF